MFDDATLWYHRDPSTRDTLACQYDTLPLESLQLSARAYNALRRGAGYRTVGDVLRATPAITITRNIGEKSLREIDAALKTILGDITFVGEGKAPTGPTPTLPKASLDVAAWEQIDIAAAEELAVSLQDMPVAKWGLPPLVKAHLAEALDSKSVGDVLRQIPAVKRRIQLFARSYEITVIRKLAATITLTDDSVVAWRDEQHAAEQRPVVPEGVKWEPIELLALPHQLLDTCYATGINTIGEVADAPMLDKAIRERIVDALGFVDGRDAVSWEDYWATRGLRVAGAHNSDVTPTLSSSRFGSDSSREIASCEMVIETARQTLDREGANLWTVLASRLGICGDRRTLQELAEGLDLTRERVRQLESKALKTLTTVIVQPGSRGGLLAVAPVLRFSARLRRLLATSDGWLAQAEADDAVRTMSTEESCSSATVLVLSAMGCKRYRAVEDSRSPIWVTPAAESFMPGALTALRRSAVEALIQPCDTAGVQTLIRERWLQMTDASALRVMKTSVALEVLPDGRWQASDALLTRQGDRLERLLRETERPLHLGELVRQLAERWDGEWDTLVERNVAAALGRDARFMPLGRSGCWALSEWPDAMSRPCAKAEGPPVVRKRLRRHSPPALTADDEARLAALSDQPAWQRYDTWNKAVAEEFFSGRYAQRPVYIDLEPEVLQRMADVTGSTAEHPEDDLVAAVRDTLHLQSGGRTTFADHRLRLRDWNAGAKDGPPPILAVLALLSLVAESMRGGDDLTGSKYLLNNPGRS